MSPHPMDGFVWLGKLPQSDARRTAPLHSVAGAEVQDSHQRGIWRPAEEFSFSGLSYNDLDDETRGRYGVRAPA